MRYLLDLMIVAKPISDKASMILQVLLRRFDDGSGSGSGSGSSCGSGLAEDSSCGRCLWYQSDAVVLLSAARNALSRLVSYGINQERDQKELIESDEFSESDRSDGLNQPCSAPLSISSSSSEPLSALGDDILAQLDEFDKELDAVLNE
ncbi:hypothetical protein J3B02_005148 [Coemansia erecta]|nr:hypothetical protein J3B02_005148 [Coemansia erecta]